MPRKVDTLARFFRRFVSFAGEWKDYEQILSQDFSYKEQPNPANPKGLALNAEELIQRIAASRKQFAAQNFEIKTHLESDILAMAEVVWTALLAADYAGFKKGKTIRAGVCMVFEFREEKILSQRVYNSGEYTST